MLFQFVSRKFSPKPSESGLLENRGFLVIGLEKKGFSRETRVKKNFEYDIRIQHQKTNILQKKSNPEHKIQLLKSSRKFLKIHFF